MPSRKKIQVLFIHGGMTFRSEREYLQYLKTRPITLEERKRWSGASLTKNLGPRFEIIRPSMPEKDRSRYLDWKIHFERYIPFLRNGCILVGSSLGGVFLAKYLSEHRFPKKIRGVYLVAPPLDDSLKGERLAGGFKLTKSFSLLEKQTPVLTLFFSKDDDVVPVSHAKKYRAKLRRAKVIVYKSKKGHFKVSSFPELARTIKADLDAQRRAGF